MRGSDLCVAHLGRNGARSLYSDRVAEQLVTLLRAGNYIGIATRAAGISRQTFGDWMRRGRAGEEPFAELREHVTAAVAEGEARNVAQIARAAAEPPTVFTGGTPDIYNPF